MSGYPVTLDPISGRAGQTLVVPILWKEGGVPVNLTGWSALVEVRTDPDALPLVELTSAAGEIVLGGVAGTISVEFTEAHTLALGAGSFKFDIRLANAGESEIVYLAEVALKFKKPYSRPVE